MRYADIWPKYAKYWDTMTINSTDINLFTEYAQYAIANKSIYQQISAGSFNAIPWAMIACIHRRESDGNFNCYLGNGQLLSRKTTEVPQNRGPFTGSNAFVEGGIDAIREEDWTNILDWRLEKQLYYMMLFNGDGYEVIGEPSPYIWGLTNIQKPGKYVADHDFDRSVMDTQPGCAPLLFEIAKLDPSIVFVRED